MQAVKTKSARQLLDEAQRTNKRYRRPLVQAFIELAGDPETAAYLINESLGGRRTRNKIIELRNGTRPLSHNVRQLMQGAVLTARFDSRTAQTLARLLDIPLPGDSPED